MHRILVAQLPDLLDTPGHYRTYLDIAVPVRLATLGLEAFTITIAAVIGSCVCAWALWYLLYKRKGGQA